MKNHLLFILLIGSFIYGELINPSNSESLRYIHILFEWEQEPDAISYNLQVSDNQNFFSSILDIEETSTIYIDTENFNWNSNYYWRVRSIYNDEAYGQWIGTSYFSTGNSILTNLEVDVFDENLIQDGVIMYSQFSPYFAVGVIDQYGSEIWNTQVAYMNHINEFGELYGVSDGGGVKLNFNQQILWETPNGIDIDSHEVKQIPNGNYMAFSPVYQIGPIPLGDWTNYFQSLGYAADGVTNEFQWMGMKIVEFDKETSEEVWSWDPFEHFTMDDNDLYETTWWDAYFNGRFDWMHTNAFHFNEEESVIYASHRHLSRISKIAYPSGEVLWNMGMPAQYNTGSDNICTDLGFSFQHHIQMLDDGDFLFFDNGNLSEMLLGDSNPTTRIRRIRIIDDSYCETVWQYDLPQGLHGLGMGSVQLLDNGNYSIYTYGSGLDNPECSILEVTPDQEIIWKVTSQNPYAAWYRTYKIPSIHPSAFSVIVDGYTLIENEDVIQLSDNHLNFSIINQSGFSQNYKYMLSDLMDGVSQMFDYSEGEFALGPNQNVDLSFSMNNNEVSATTISLSVWPIHHGYAIKELMFSVLPPSSLPGDINQDEIFNVLDVVLMVNIILGLSDSVDNGDINGDNAIDILDVVLLINIILDV